MDEPFRKEIEDAIALFAFPRPTLGHCAADSDIVIFDGDGALRNDFRSDKPYVFIPTNGTEVIPGMPSNVLIVENTSLINVVSVVSEAISKVPGVPKERPANEIGYE